MSSIQRINTIGDEENQFSLTIGGVTKSVTRAEMAQLNNPTKIKERLEELFGMPLPNVWPHINRGDPFSGVVIATGENPPDVWPEDEQ